MESTDNIATMVRTSSLLMQQSYVQNPQFHTTTALPPEITEPSTTYIMQTNLHMHEYLMLLLYRPQNRSSRDIDRLLWKKMHRLDRLVDLSHVQSTYSTQSVNQSTLATFVVQCVQRSAVSVTAPMYPWPCQCHVHGLGLGPRFRVMVSDHVDKLHTHMHNCFMAL